VPNDDLQVRDEYNFHLVFLNVKLKTQTLPSLQFLYEYIYIKKEVSLPQPIQEKILGYTGMAIFKNSLSTTIVV
jgi:hypothetical protein